MNGRTASCTATRSVSGCSVRSAFSTDSWRELPPCTTRTRSPNSLVSMSRTHSISSSRTATTTSPTRGFATNLRTVWMMIGEPSSNMNCLRLVPACAAGVFPIRVPNPAAGKMTAIFMRLRFYRGFLGSDRSSGGLRRFRLARDGLIVPIGAVLPLVELAEDHLAGGGLEHAGHRDVDGLGDHLLGVIDHHHGAVIEIRDALVVLLALFENEHAH